MKKSKPAGGAPDQDDGKTKKPKPRKPRLKSAPEVKVDEDEATEPKSPEEQVDETTAPKAAVRRKKKPKKGEIRFNCLYFFTLMHFHCRNIRGFVTCNRDGNVVLVSLIWIKLHCPYYLTGTLICFSHQFTDFTVCLAVLSFSSM